MASDYICILRRNMLHSVVIALASSCGLIDFLLIFLVKIFCLRLMSKHLLNLFWVANLPPLRFGSHRR